MIFDAVSLLQQWCFAENHTPLSTYKPPVLIPKSIVEARSILHDLSLLLRALAFRVHFISLLLLAVCLTGCATKNNSPHTTQQRVDSHFKTDVTQAATSTPVTSTNEMSSDPTGPLALNWQVRTGLASYHDGDDGGNDAHWSGFSWGDPKNGVSTAGSPWGTAYFWDASAASNAGRFQTEARTRFLSGDRYHTYWACFEDLSADRPLRSVWDARAATAQEYTVRYEARSNEVGIRIRDQNGSSQWMPAGTPTESVSCTGGRGRWHFIEIAFDGFDWETCLDGACSSYPDVGPTQPVSVYRPMRIGHDGGATMQGAIDQLSVSYHMPTSVQRRFLYNNGAGRTLSEWDGPILPTLTENTRHLYAYLATNNNSTLHYPEGAVTYTRPSWSSPEERAAAYLNAIRGNLGLPSYDAGSFMLDDGNGNGIEHAGDPFALEFPGYARLNTYMYGMRPWALSDLNWTGLSNPFYQSEALCRRSAAKVFPVAMLVSYGLESGEYYASTVHFTGGYLEQLGELIYSCYETYPNEVQNALIAMARRWTTYMTQRGPTDVNSNMDAKALEGVSWLVPVVERVAHPAESAIKGEVEALWRRWLYGQADGTLATWDHDAAIWHPSGIPLEADGPSVDYGSRFMKHAITGRLLLGTESRWDFVTDALGRSAQLMAAWNGVDANGTLRGDRATGNRVPGSYLLDVQEWDELAITGFGMYFCNATWDWVGCRIGLEDYRGSHTWPSVAEMERTIAGVAGTSAPALSAYTPSYDGRLGSPWPETVSVPPHNPPADWASTMATVRQSRDARTKVFAHKDAGLPDTVITFSESHPVFRWRHGTDREGRGFSYMLELFTANGQANVPSYGEFGGGKVATMTIDDYGVVVTNERFPHTQGWWQNDNDKHWPLESFLITASDGSDYRFAHGDDVMDDATVMTYPTGATYQFDWPDPVQGDGVAITKTMTDLPNGVEVTVELNLDTDQNGETFDVTTASYRLPIVGDGLYSMAYWDGEAWVPVQPGTWSATATEWVRLVRADTAYVQLPFPRPVRGDARTFDRLTASAIRNLYLSFHPTTEGQQSTLNDVSFTYRILTKAADPGLDPPGNSR